MLLITFGMTYVISCRKNQEFKKSELDRTEQLPAQSSALQGHSWKWCDCSHCISPSSMALHSQCQPRVQSFPHDCYLKHYCDLYNSDTIIHSRKTNIICSYAVYLSMKCGANQKIYCRLHSLVFQQTYCIFLGPLSGRTRICRRLLLR
jgi:hypothetical protein